MDETEQIESTKFQTETNLELPITSGIGFSKLSASKGIEKKLFNYIYNRINSREDLKVLAKDLCLSYDILLSIYSFKYVEETKKNISLHRSPIKVAEYYARYLSGQNLVDLSEEINLAPCLLARIILTSFFRDIETELSKVILK